MPIANSATSFSLGDDYDESKNPFNENEEEFDASNPFSETNDSAKFDPRKRDSLNPFDVENDEDFVPEPEPTNPFSEPQNHERKISRDSLKEVIASRKSSQNESKRPNAANLVTGKNNIENVPAKKSSRDSIEKESPLHSESSNPDIYASIQNCKSPVPDPAQLFGKIII